MNKLPVVFVTTYPPQHCGIGKSAYDVVQRIRALRRVFVVGNRVAGGPPPHEEIVQAWSKRSLRYPFDASRAVAQFAPTRGAIVQVNHHFNLYGGAVSNLEFPLLLLLLRLRGYFLVVELMSVIDPTVGRAEADEDLRRFSHGWVRAGLWVFYRLVGGLAWKVVVPGASGARILTDRFGLDPGRIVVVSPGWDAYPARASQENGTTSVPGPVKFLFHGFLDRTKGLEVLIDAFAATAKALPEAQLVIAGEASPADGAKGRVYVDWLHQRVRQQGLGDRVRFTGYLEEEALLRELRSADIIVLPYTMRLSLGGSAVLTRVASLGKPLIASSISRFVDELRPDQDALLVPPGEVEPLAKAMLTLASDPAKRSRIGAQLLALAPERTWEAAAARLEREIYSPADAASQAAQ